MSWTATIQLVLVVVAFGALTIPPIAMVLACFLAACTGDFQLSWVGRVTAVCVGIAFLAGIAFFVLTGVSVAGIL